MQFGMRLMAGDQLRRLRGILFNSTSAITFVEGSGVRFGAVADMRFQGRGKVDRPGNVVRGDPRDVDGLLRLPMQDTGTVFVRDYGDTTRDIRWELEVGPGYSSAAGYLKAFPALGATAACDDATATIVRHAGGRWTWGVAGRIVRPTPPNRQTSTAATGRLTTSAGYAYSNAAACDAGVWTIGLANGADLSLGRWLASTAAANAQPGEIAFPPLDLPPVQNAEDYDAAWIEARILAVDGDRLLVQALHSRRIRTPYRIHMTGFDATRDGYAYGEELRLVLITIRAGAVQSSPTIGVVQANVTPATPPPAPDQYGLQPEYGGYASYAYVGSGSYLTAAMRTKRALRQFAVAWDAFPAATAPTLAFPVLDDGPDKVDGQDPRPFIGVARLANGSFATIREDWSVIQTYGAGDWLAYSGQSAVEHDMKVPPAVWARLNP